MIFLRLSRVIYLLSRYFVIHTIYLIRSLDPVVALAVFVPLCFELLLPS